jgi:hypothetical protein
MPSAVRTEKAHGRFSRRGLKFCDTELMPVICPTCQMPELPDELDRNPKTIIALFRRCCSYGGDLPDVSSRSSATHRLSGFFEFDSNLPGNRHPAFSRK